MRKYFRLRCLRVEVANLAFQSFIGYGSAYPAMMGTGSGNPMEYLLATLNLNGYKTETEEEEEEEPTTPAPPSFDGIF